MTDSNLNEQSSEMTDDADINPLMMPLIAAMETGLNQLLKMDPQTFHRLGRFNNKIIAFHFTDIHQTLYFFPDHRGIQIIADYKGDADTIISGTLLAFARMAMANENEKTATVFKGDIKIAGDINLGQQFQSLIRQLDIDWEEHLSKLTGDVIAHSLGNMLRGAAKWGRDSINTMGQDASEYLQFESRDVASGPEIKHFNAQIDELRNGVERAEARINRLIQGWEKSQQTRTVHKKTNQ